MTGAGWITEVMCGTSLSTVLEELGLEVRRGRVYPCPACNEETRSSVDRMKGPVGITNNAAGWACHRCGAKGDAVDAASFVLHRARFRDIAPEAKKSVRAWFASRGWCEGIEGVEAPKTTRRPPRPDWAPDLSDDAPPCVSADEVRAFWDRCLPIDEAKAPAEVRPQQQDCWLTVRSWGVEPHAVTSLDLARALPHGELPSWARCRGASWTDGWGMVLPVLDPKGELVQVRARWTNQRRPAPGGVKEAAPVGARFAGTVYACPMGRALLRGVHVIEDGSGRLEWDRRVVITEGPKDAIAARCHHTSLPHYAESGTAKTFAVFGVWSGAWSPALAARIPDDSLVVIATDEDAQGEKYAEAVIASLQGRVRLLRRRARTSA